MSCHTTVRNGPGFLSTDPGLSAKEGLWRPIFNLNHCMIGLVVGVGVAGKKIPIAPISLNSVFYDLSSDVPLSCIAAALLARSSVSKSCIAGGRGSSRI